MNTDQTPEYINSTLNTVLDDPVLLRVAIRCEEILLREDNEV